MTKQELLNKFANNTPAYRELTNDLKRNWRKRSVKLRQSVGVTSDTELTAGYHYLVCPITECPVYSFGKPYADKLGITMEEFYTLFPEYNGVISSPYNVEVRYKNKATRKLDNAVYVTVNKVTVDLADIKHAVNTRGFRDKYGDGEDCIENFHYFVCPITKLKILGFNAPYFDNLKKVGISKNDFITQFPHIDVEKCITTPSYRGITINEFNAGIVTKQHADDLRISKAAKYKQNNPSFLTRNMDISLHELLELVRNGNDPIIDNYLYTRQQVNVLEDIALELGIPENKLIEGYHYITHPLSGFAMSRIGVRSITVFGITKERFYEWFPELRHSKITKYTTNKIKESLSRPNEEGIRPIDISSAGRKKRFAEVDENGKTYQSIVSEKTKNTHLSTIDEYGRNGYQRLADSNASKSIQTKGSDVHDSEWERYRTIVLFIMARFRPYFRELDIEYGTWTSSDYDADRHSQVDHKFSIAEGFKHKISPLCIANFDNLEVMTGRKNENKRDSCSITIDDVATINGMSIAEMNDEYERIMAVVKRQISEGELSTSMNTLIEAGHDIALKVKPYNDFYRQHQYKDNE